MRSAQSDNQTDHASTQSGGTMTTETNHEIIKKILKSGTAAYLGLAPIWAPSAAWAQSSPPSPSTSQQTASPADEEDEEEIIITGTQIRGTTPADRKRVV